MVTTIPRLRVLQAGAQADVDVLVLDIDKVDKDPGHRSLVLDRAMRTRDMDNERFLRKVRERLDRCAMQQHACDQVLLPRCGTSPAACRVSCPAISIKSI